MARITLEMPKEYPFSTELEVYIEHINRGNHLGNERLVAFLNEARLRYLPAQLCDLAGEGFGWINGDLAVIYRGEAHHGNVLRVQAAVADFHRYGFDMYFHVSERGSGAEIALAKMGLLLFDFTQHRLQAMSEALRQAVAAAPAPGSATIKAEKS